VRVCGCVCGSVCVCPFQLSRRMVWTLYRSIHLQLTFLNFLHLLTSWRTHTLTWWEKNSTT